MPNFGRYVPAVQPSGDLRLRHNLRRRVPQKIVGGLLTYCFSLIQTGPLKSWQWIFFIYSINFVLYSSFVVCWMPDYLIQTKYFTKEDKELMVARVRTRQVSRALVKERAVLGKHSRPSNLGACITLSTLGLEAFQGIIIKGFGFTALDMQLLVIVLGFYIIILLLGLV